VKTEVKVLELTKDEIITILSGFNSYSGYWARLTYDQDIYVEARVREAKIQKDESIAWEDVLANMLLNGNILIISDAEEDFETQSLNLKKLIEGVNLSIQNNKLPMEDEDWDAQDADVIIQNAVFGEIVFG